MRLIRNQTHYRRRAIFINLKVVLLLIEGSLNRCLMLKLAMWQDTNFWSFMPRNQVR